MPFSFLQHLIVRQTLVALNIPTNYIFWYFPACFETVIVYRDDVDLSNYATSFFLETPGNASSSKWNISKVPLCIGIVCNIEFLLMKTEACQQICQTDAQCNYFMYDYGDCHLKKYRGNIHESKSIIVFLIFILKNRFYMLTLENVLWTLIKSDCEIWLIESPSTSERLTDLGKLNLVMAVRFKAQPAEVN